MTLENALLTSETKLFFKEEDEIEIKRFKTDLSVSINRAASDITTAFVSQKNKLKNSEAERRRIAIRPGQAPSLNDYMNLEDHQDGEESKDIEEFFKDFKKIELPEGIRVLSI